MQHSVYIWILGVLIVDAKHLGELHSITLHQLSVHHQVKVCGCGVHHRVKVWGADESHRPTASCWRCFGRVVCICICSTKHFSGLDCQCADPFWLRPPNCQDWILGSNCSWELKCIKLLALKCIEMNCVELHCGLHCNKSQLYWADHDKPAINC